MCALEHLGSEGTDKCNCRPRIYIYIYTELQNNIFIAHTSASKGRNPAEDLMVNKYSIQKYISPSTVNVHCGATMHCVVSCGPSTYRPTYQQRWWCVHAAFQAS